MPFWRPAAAPSRRERVQNGGGHAGKAQFLHYASLAQAQLIDLNGDGMEELFVLDSFGQPLLLAEREPHEQGDRIWAGGALNWYLCRDTATGELGIEYESIGGGDFSGGSHTFYYLAHHRDYPGGVQRQRLRAMSVWRLWGDTVSVTNHRDETRAAPSGHAEVIHMGSA